MIKRLIRFIRSFFSFSYAEAKGFLVMAAGIALMAAGYIIYNALPSDTYSSYAEDKAKLDSLVRLIEAREGVEKETGREKGLPAKVVERKEAVYFSFNPNHLSADSLQLLGVPGWLAERISRYRQKGGVFRKKEDLLKIYGFEESLYAQLEPYINIPAVLAAGREKLPPEEGSRRINSPKDEGERVPVSRLPININRADSLELQQLKGIGPVLSSRIVKFRNKLGGFVHLDQLYEVYGLDSSLVKELVNVLHLDPDFQPEPIAINTASVEELAAHPYISPAQARLIHSYRTQHGNFTSFNELLNIHTFNSKFVNKVAPYIRFD